MKYDHFQEEAIKHINNGHSVIVSAPTGAGKTAIAEHIITSCLEKHVGVVYTAPIKALSNQKFRDFQASYGDHIGILTGDVSINPHALVLIMTTEIFRNKVLDEPDSLRKYSWIIYDEIHYLDNPERGTVWEESLIFLPGHMNLLGLSATIPNIKQLAAWIESIHNKPVQTVIEKNRPVPLHFRFYCRNTVTEKIDALRRMQPAKKDSLHNLISYVNNHAGLPAIYFVFGRKRAEDLAHDLEGLNLLRPEERSRINKLLDELLARYELNHEPAAQRLVPLIRRGIAYHHAGMLPTLKEMVERLFTSRLLKLIFTTETFALGINMPSRSVVFDALRKFYGRFVRNLKTRDFYQMAGRAGRRGIDEEGFVYCRINLQRTRLHDVKRIIYGPPEEVRSQLNTSYATILNLYEKHREELFKIYPLSFHYYQSRKDQHKQALRVIEGKLQLLKETGYIEKGMLTEKGYFAKAVYGYELILGELYEYGILEQLDEFALGVIAAAVVFEPRKNQLMPRGLSKNAKRLRKICTDLAAEIKQRERLFRIFPATKQPFFHLSSCMETWLRGSSFQKALSATDTDEGEVVRYFRMAIQILREITDARVSSYTLKDRIAETIHVINRDIIDAEKQLREG